MRTLPALSLVLLSSAASAAEPWVDPDPAEPPSRFEIGEVGIAPELEYRSQLTSVRNISLATETNRHYNAITHRGRVGVTVDYDQAVMISTSLDLLDGVLWGDNGTFGSDPSSDSGLQVSARDPNVVKPCMRYVGGDADPLKASGYAWGLCEANAISVRRLYAQVNTPIGALRVGRQPVGVGMAVQTTSGDGRTNRFGVADAGDMVDRVLFATKPLEAFKPAAERDRTENRGLIVAVMYDRWVSDSPVVFADDVQQVAWALRFLEPDLGPVRDLEAQFFHAHRWEEQFDTLINTVGGRLIARVEDFHAGIDLAANIGHTREVATAYSVISNDPVVDQDILQFGARGAVRYNVHPDGDRERPPMFTGYFEVDYASGDGDPLPGTPLSAFRFSEDTNVGLLLFDHVVHFQSARAAAAGSEIVGRLGAVSFPSERIDTRGTFTDAFAIFPQVDFRPHDTLLFRAGVLVAWAPEVVIDQVQSLQANDGVTIEDDLVNFVGGVPGNFYGTEIDGRFQWRFIEHFALDLEAAVLFPGDALQDVNGQAVNSFLMQGRTTFFF